LGAGGSLGEREAAEGSRRLRKLRKIGWRHV
jgi:hypothetical protein